MVKQDNAKLEQMLKDQNPDDRRPQEKGPAARVQSQGKTCGEEKTASVPKARPKVKTKHQRAGKSAFTIGKKESERAIVHWPFMRQRHAFPWNGRKESTMEKAKS